MYAVYRGSHCPGGDDNSDTDGDGIPDFCDPCTDTDGDGLGDPGFPSNTCPEDAVPDQPIEQGDLNNDGSVGLADAILTMRVITECTSSSEVCVQAEVNGDDKIGTEEMILILQQCAEVR